MIGTKEKDSESVPVVESDQDHEKDLNATVVKEPADAGDGEILGTPGVISVSLDVTP